MSAPSIEDVIPLHVADFRIPDLSAEHRLAPLSGTTGTVLAFAVVQARGITLYETGVGQPDLPMLPSTFGALIHDRDRVAARPIDKELERHGIEIADVRAIINSHLHWDHCGGNPLFPGVPIYVQAAEHEAARSGGRKYTVPDWVDFPGAEFVVVDGDAIVSGGIKILSTPGHTTGHQSLVVETRHGRVALAGQAVYLRAEYEEILDGGPGYGGGVLPELTLDSARRLVEQQPARVYFSHDHATWSATP